MQSHNPAINHSINYNIRHQLPKQSVKSLKSINQSIIHPFHPTTKLHEQATQGDPPSPLPPFQTQTGQAIKDGSILNQSFNQSPSKQATQ